MARVLGISFCAAYFLSGCSGGGASSVAGGAAVSVVPAAAQHGSAALRSGSARRAITPPTCGSALGINSFVGGTNNNHAHGASSGVLAGEGNAACDAWAGIGSGLFNAVSSSGNRGNTDAGSFIGAGASNTIDCTSVCGVGANFIGAGEGNAIDAAAFDGFIGAGASNVVSAQHGFIGAGQDNTVSVDRGVVVGGSNNSVAGFETFVGGGASNVGSGEYAVIGGGFNNSGSGKFGSVTGGESNQASGQYAAVPGGQLNVARGQGSFAAGMGSNAGDNGDFVWSDDPSGGGVTPISVSGDNEFLARARGGVTFYSSANLASGVSLAPGSGTWSSLSDRTVKTAIVGVSDDGILAKVATLPIGEWSYSTERGVRHVGPMAQDFYAAFNVGEDDRHITSIDEDGVALAAIKALNAKLTRKDVEIRVLQQQMAVLTAEVHAIQAARGVHFGPRSPNQ
ncbi:MAG: tail fiber domain-containing protein [Vulcanimicrobiaceae bacterium]